MTAMVTCSFCGEDFWIEIRSGDEDCPMCRHQLILAAMASLGGGLSPDKMAEMSIRAADAVIKIRAIDGKDRGSDPPQAKCKFCYSLLDVSGECSACKMPQAETK